MTFALDINKFIEKTQGNAHESTKRIVGKVLERVVNKSPVGNTKNWKDQEHLPKGYVGGHFRKNWQVGIDSAPSGEVDGVDPDGGPTIELGKSKIPEQAGGHTYYLVNNLDYAQALEDGHSTQAKPGVIVAGTIVEYQSYIRETLSELK